MDSQSQAQQQQEQQPTLCAAGCGSSETHGFCSVCYKANQSSALAASSAPSPSHPAAPAAAPAAAAAPVPEPKLAEAAPAQQAAEEAAPAADALAAAEAAPADEPADDRPVQENRGRCFCCRKKVGLLGFECRCGYVFCSGHRHARDHACPFDYATFDKANLAKANNKVVAAKVDKL
ncbi:hypothetical protein CHLNCDRAFT_144583 [Chlorella variabilis]|uniref:AN1-type domain-containing protein n=1 Tax=Chlorella variabilis TaxID=554065 RepID=E1ZBR5_CHLVA|nr:hypothetical protein CHLNCDRAFT_144583 [Chlorella variabilis]EFN56686.1 hypothetical protein CHLNCDRAFT_144583 [Chlorella variabilis]|eukprot:XP_005848788.1 hypothetical protein CHLNCDRAFT_144583 [Chlorella variabilis]